MIEQLKLLERGRQSWQAVTLISVALVCASNSQAQGLTYVDADDFVNVNLSTSSGEPLGNAIDIFGTSTDNGGDGLWRIRGTATGNMFGASGIVYEADPGEDVPELIQTVSGLASGTSYDMYAVWWSATGGENWNIRGALTSNPNSNTLYDRTGGLGIPGSLAVFANWQSLPGDNPDIEDGFPGVEGATLEGNRVMLVSKVGTAIADGSGEVQVFIDDLFDESLGIAQRTWFDGVAYAPAGATANTVTATIDRTTGNLTVSSMTSDFSINAINIASGAGSLASSEWSSITGNLDSAGDSTFDGDAWEVTSSTSFSLAESEVDRDPSEEVVLVDGGTFGPGGASTIDFGNVWLASPFEDVSVNLTLNDSGFSVPVTVEFTGGTQQAIGDYNADGNIDVDDYGLMLGNLNRTFSDISRAEAHGMGDITGDLVTNFSDLVAFRDVYDTANGAGSFALISSGVVPEPGCFALLSMLAAGWLGFRCRRHAPVVAAGALMLALVAAAPEASAQITYVDADEEAGGNTVGLPGGWVARGAGASTDALNFANEGGALQGNGEVDELATTFSIPNAGFYQIYAFYWSDGGNWNIQAGLESGALTDFDQNTPGILTVNEETQMSGSPTEVLGLNVLGQGDDTFDDYVDGNRTIYAASIGFAAVASDNDTVTAYIDHNSDLGARTWYDGLGYAVAPAIPTLEVNTSTGEISIKNQFDVSVDMSYYEITSASGSLNPDGWNSLDDQNIDAIDGDDAGSVAGDSLLEGWDEAGGVGGGGDLDGDYNGDLTVDAADYTVWRDGLGTTYVQEDYDTWRDNYGATSNPGGLSPEILNEVNLLNITTLAAQSETSLGTAFNTAGSQDLVFRYGNVEDGSLTTSLVTYVGEGGAAATAPEPTGVALLLSALCVTLGRRRIC
ncbi:hypothetical protein [Posidoniimonas corsicana]|uniref:hypothetical protein n=1 Tax=Posidoniimonas corsicana TaxID=1938618 RepID=UPI0011B42608|nr:hypothetical protein [Posidoniimonas corsicana]